MRPRADELVWLVTALDRAGPRAAGVRALREDKLRDAFAVAATGRTVEKLPLESPMTLIPAYRSRPSALHSARAGVGAAFCCSLRAGRRALPQPARPGRGARRRSGSPGICAGVGREVGRSLRLALPFALLVAIVNALVYQEGDTLLLRGDEFLGRRWDVTLEATVEGLMNGMRIVVLVAALGGLMSAAVDPDELLKALRRFSYRSALTASLATRLVPVLARDAARMSDAARCRPHPPGRLAVVAGRAGGRARPRRRRGRGARGARLRAGGRPARRRASRSRATTCAIGAAALADRRAGASPAPRPASATWRPTRRSTWRSARPSSRWRCALVAPAPLRCVGRSARLGVARA